MNRPLLSASGITSATALVCLIRMIAGNSPDEAYVLWLLGAVSAFFTIKNHRPSSSRMDLPAAWGALAAALLTALLLPSAPRSWPLWLGLCSVLAWSSGALLAVKLSLSVLIFTVFIPAFDYLHTLLSLPLSRTSTALTSTLLRFAGLKSSYDRSILLLGDNRIAVTAACSGIELLSALLLLGWLIVYFEHKRFLIRLAHYLTLLPIIILCNSLRLVLVASLSLVIGDRAFNNTLHSLLGYGVVIASTLLLFGTGRLFKAPEDKP